MRMGFLAMAAALSAGTVSAQAPKAALQTPAAPTAAVTPVNGGRAPVVVQGSGSCPTCTSAARVHNPGLFAIGTGTVNPVGCGCFESEKTFLFGGCKQFFNPQKTCGEGCGHGVRGFNDRCPTIIYGPGLGVPANNCAGTFSYLFR